MQFTKRPAENGTYHKGIRFSLEHEDFEVECAYDGEEALEKVKEKPFDIILLDVMLPKLTGFEVCQQIREFSDVPIIMLTAKGDDMDKILGLEYGADDYITKPFNPECRNTKPYYEKIGVACPKCGKDIVLKKTQKGRKYYGCIGNPECDFMVWQRPSNEKCPVCGSILLEKGNKLVCSKEGCGFVKEKEKDRIRQDIQCQYDHCLCWFCKRFAGRKRRGVVQCLFDARLVVFPLGYRPLSAIQ